MSTYEFFSTVMGVTGVVSTLGTPLFMFVLVRDQMGRRGDARSRLFRVTRHLVWAMAAVAVLAWAAAAWTLDAAEGAGAYDLILAIVLSVPVLVSAVLFAIVSLWETRRHDTASPVAARDSCAK